MHSNSSSSCELWPGYHGIEEKEEEGMMIPCLLRHPMCLLVHSSSRCCCPAACLPGCENPAASPSCGCRRCQLPAMQLIQLQGTCNLV